MNSQIDWEEVPEKEFEMYKKRIEIVELCLNESIDSLTKKEAIKDFCRLYSVSDRTIRNWIHRYKKKGPRRLLFYRKREKSPRIHDESLRKRITSLVEEVPTRTVSKLRKLLREDESYRHQIETISDRTLYRFLGENGMGQKERYRMLSDTGRKAYHAFEAPFSMALVQGDARDGIWIPGSDGKPVKTYLFLWLCDHSRKILFGKYYLNEKLPCMEDSFRYLILRYGIPEKIYLDNGSVYISKHFASILAEMEIKQLHHKPYQAFAKGKIEACNKTIKYEFQSEAQLAGIKTIDELNTAFWAWSEVEYNKRVHSSTGEAPDERFINGLPGNHRRVEDIEKFNAMFLWKENRTISKYGKIKLYKNQYPVEKLSHGTVVQVRLDPFNLDEVYIYDQGNNFIEKTSPSKKVNDRAPSVPEESKKGPAKVSQDSINYFAKLREKYRENVKKQNEMNLSGLKERDEKEDSNE
jgi:transposase